MKDFRVALAQINPALGNVEKNLAAHLSFINKARKQGADLVVFPELSLTGYFLRDLTQECALSENDPAIAKILAASRSMAIVFGFVEESPDHRFYNTAIWAEDGKILHKHRKVYLPTYGIFEEARYFAPGESFRAFDSKFGRFGILVCEDLWHLSSSYLYFLQGVDAMVCISSSPGRGIAGEGAQVQTAKAWGSLLVAQSTFFNVYSIFCNRVGFEDGVLFWGGSRVLSPFGRPIVQAKGLDEQLVRGKMPRASSLERGEMAAGTAEVSALRRSRIFTPLLRDEKTRLVYEQMRHILDENQTL